MLPPLEVRRQSGGDGGPGRGEQHVGRACDEHQGGLIVVITGGLTLDLGGNYTACSNADDRIEPSNILGMKIAESARRRSR